MMDQGLHMRGHSEIAEEEQRLPPEPSGSRRDRQRQAAEAAREHERSFVQFFNCRYGWSDGLIDCLTIAGIGTRFARGRAAMTTREQWIFGTYIAVVLVHMIWRWLSPRCYARWRHLSSTVLTMFATCAPWFWHRRIGGLAKKPFAPPGTGLLQTAVAAVRVALVSSYTLQLTVYGMGRPAPSWLKLPTHLASTAVAVSHAGAMCRTPVFAQPAVVYWFARAHRAMRGLTSLLPLAASPLLPEPDGPATCAAVITMVHISLGFAIPMMVAVSMEVHARQLHALQHRQHWRAWRRQKRRPWWRLAAWLGAGPRLFGSWAADAVAALALVAAVWDIVVALRSSDAAVVGALP